MAIEEEDFMKNPYERCPTFETGSFILRLVSEDDCEGLLKCYSDRKAQKFFNSDRCTGDFCMDTIEDMVLCTKAWLGAYSQKEFIRFSIVDKSLSRAIGTVEMFGHAGETGTRTGILRVDVSSEYETAPSLNQIFGVCSENFFDWFDVDLMATKAIPQAVERRKALRETHFHEGPVSEGEHYFLRSK